MGKYLKKILGIGFISLLLFLILRFYLKVRAVINLDSSLLEYLKSVYEEDIGLEVSLALNNLKVKVSCSGDLKLKEELIRKSIIEYIRDFYPVLNVKYLKVEIVDLPRA